VSRPPRSCTFFFDIDGVRLVDDISAGLGGSGPQGFASVGGTALDAQSGGTEVFSAREPKARS
jgi:hypothetical protein